MEEVLQKTRVGCDNNKTSEHKIVRQNEAFGASMLGKQAIFQA